ncbi:hypothetical protein F511_24271 [Dorcoceras hygrometricum]|uniref:Uncharacterized protein n=1 Tax=Dorcoceras hygrometricum TaxID=472368 RepID=A0A2Z7DD21_9LAMI|nr:hypothetical protein F511_24271 [Dorcoceras hygrometricum]
MFGHFVQAVPCPTFEESELLVIVVRKVARASGNTALSSPCWDVLAPMRRVANYHSS